MFKALIEPKCCRFLHGLGSIFAGTMLLVGAAHAFDTDPPAKITEMDIYGASSPAGAVVYVRLDPAVTIAIPGFSTCTAPSNFIILSTSTDADRAVLAQLQTAYALKKQVKLHITGCGTVGTVTYPIGNGVWTN